MERYLCDTCLYAKNCQFIAKHREGAIGCSAGFGWCENMDRGTHDEFYCASGKRLEVEP